MRPGRDMWDESLQQVLIGMRESDRCLSELWLDGLEKNFYATSRSNRFTGQGGAQNA